jgi:F-type H+-transporting ATPase subunit a
MEEHVPWVTVLVNWLFGKPATALLSALHIQPSYPEYPIPTHVAMEFVVFAVAIVFFLWLKRWLSVERPGAVQQCMESLLANPLRLGVRDLLENNVGHGYERYVAMLGSIGIFVLLCNLISLVPTLESPTAQVSVPFGCAVVVFLYYNWCGFQHHGPFGYGKHFLGPNLYMSPIMLPIELISNAARLLSLTVRLWVNMMVSELLLCDLSRATRGVVPLLRQAQCCGICGGYSSTGDTIGVHCSSYFCWHLAGVCIHDSSGHLCGWRGFRRTLKEARASTRKQSAYTGMMLPV